MGKCWPMLRGGLPTLVWGCTPERIQLGRKLEDKLTFGGRLPSDIEDLPDSQASHKGCS